MRSTQAWLAILALLCLAPSGSGAAAEDPQLAEVRSATAQFERVDTALASGYAPQFGCVSHATHGAMGIHHINGDLFADPAIDALKPEAIMYEPRPDGSLQAVGIEYVVLQDAWHQAGHAEPPVLLGQRFNLTTNFFDVPPFYALHVWLWRPNPAGLFASYNPTVSCAAGAAQSLPATGSGPPVLPVWIAALALGLVGAGRLLHRRPSHVR